MHSSSRSLFLSLKRIKSSLRIYNPLRKQKRTNRRPVSADGSINGLPALTEISIHTLPLDVQLVIISFLDLEEVRIIRLTCHRLYNACESPVVWHALAAKFPERSDALVVDPLIRVETLTMPDIKQVVLRSDFLLRNLEGRDAGVRSPKCVARSTTTEIDTVVTSLLSAGCAFLSEDIILMQSEQELRAFDIRLGTRLGNYSFDCKPVMVILRRCQDDSKTIHSLVIGIIKDNEATHTQLYVLCINPALRDAKIQYDRIAEHNNLHTLASIISNEQVVTADLESSLRLIYVLYVPEQGLEPQAMRLLVIFDWNEPLYLTLDTELTHNWVTSHSIARLSSDYSSIIVLSQGEGAWSVRSYSLAEMRALLVTSTRKKAGACHLQICPDRQLSIAYSPIDATVTPDSATLYNYWTCCQLRMDYGRVASQLSHFYVHYRANQELKWSITHYYSSEEAPFPAKPFTWTMSRPLTVPYFTTGIPLMAWSFHQFAWVEQVRSSRIGGRSKLKCTLLLMTFPRHDEKDGKYTVSSFPDINSKILEDARFIFLEPQLGAVIIITTKNRLHRFQYA